MDLSESRAPASWSGPLPPAEPPVMLSSLAVPFLLGAAVFSPPTLPAQGEQESLLDLGEPAMVRIAAESASGTSCVLVDQRRGPFAKSSERDFAQ